MHLVGESITQAKAIKLSKVSNSITAIVPLDTPVVNTMKTFSNYPGAFELQNGVKVSDSRIKHIVDDMLPSNHLPICALSTYLRYVRVFRLLVNNKHVLCL